ncbi:hypothetical protein FH588_20590 [Leptospira interrogans]|uniref:hypothetical protein n=1 Tax=Leptospira interrogans TaxID=173 RepID=UPI001F4CB453|nr:hypothetical protein [Leptospira interrogans]UNE66873.1 hypothetical protein FH588_20590 [Leptospira interrogans]
MEKVLEVPLYQLIAATAFIFLLILLKYWKDLKPLWIWVFSAISKNSDTKLNTLLAEIKPQKDVIENYKQRLEKIEKYIESNRGPLENHVGILEHPAKVFVESQGLTFRFTNHLRISDAHRFSEFLKLLEERVRLMPFADQRLTLDLTGVKTLNSKALSSLHELFHRVGTNNGIRLKYLFDKTNKEHVRYAHNLEKISADLPTDSAIVCLVTSHSESEEQFAPKSKKRRNNR